MSHLIKLYIARSYYFLTESEQTIFFIPQKLRQSKYNRMQIVFFLEHLLSSSHLSLMNH